MRIQKLKCNIVSYSCCIHTEAGLALFSTISTLIFLSNNDDHLKTVLSGFSKGMVKMTGGFDKEPHTVQANMNPYVKMFVHVFNICLYKFQCKNSISPPRPL